MMANRSGKAPASPSMLLLPDAALIGDGLTPVRDAAILVKDESIAWVGHAGALDSQAQAASVTPVPMPGLILCPGLINAHQHGRGLTQLQLGFPDDYLESWFPSHRKSGVLDPYAMTLLAALRMIAGGVTAAIQANTGYGTGDYAAELAACARAYADSGLRVFVGTGAMDQAEVVYPAGTAAAFRAGLPDDLSAWLDAGEPEIHCRRWQDVANLTQRLSDRYSDHPRLTFGYAPAGPQWASDTLLAGLLTTAADRGLGVHLHGLESYPQAIVLQGHWPEGLLGHLKRLGPIDERISVGHAVWLSQADLDVAARAGATLVRNPASNLRLRAGIAPLAAYMADGVNVAIGTDNMGLNDTEDLFQEIRLAGHLARSPWLAAEPADAPPGALSMLRAATVNGARAAQLAGRCGVIAEGWQADLIALDLSRMRDGYWHEDMSERDLIYHRATSADVFMTMVGGEILYWDRSFVRHDLAAALESAVADAGRAQAAVDPAHAAKVDRLVSAIVDHYRSREAAARRQTAAPPWSPLAAGERRF